MSRSVLVIDDNAAFRSVLGRLLAVSGFALVPGAGTGADGVRLAEDHDPELVMVDVQLPDVDGFEVTERLARLDRPPDVILMSTLDATDLGTLVAESSARGFIPKNEISAAAIEALLEPAR